MKLLKGCCLELLTTIESDSIDCVVNDPPYKTTRRGHSGGTRGMLKNGDFILGNGGFTHNDLCYETLFPQVYRVMKKRSHGYLFCNNKNLVLFHTALLKAGFSIFKTLIWSKNNAITNMYYMDSHEYIVFFRKGKSKKIHNCGTKSVLSYDNVRNKLHPTQKPIKLLETLITNSTQQNEVVLDFSMGCGSTGIACLNTNRDFIGMEIDDYFFDVARQRITEMQRDYGSEGWKNEAI